MEQIKIWLWARKIFAPVFMALLLLLLCTPAFASAAEGNGMTVTVTDLGEAPQSGTQKPNYSYPVDIKAEGNTIQKSYEVPPDFDPQTLVEKQYRLTDIVRRELPVVPDIKTATQSVTIQLESNDTEKALTLFSDKLPYDEGGYKGDLMLDPASLSITHTSEDEKSNVITDTQVFTDLESNDPHFIPEITSKSGIALQRVDIQWTQQEDSYTATAFYRGTAIKKVESGFTATADYTGEVSCTKPGNVLYTLVYEAAPEENPGNAKANYLFIAVITSIVILLVNIVFLNIRVIRNKQQPSISLVLPGSVLPDVPLTLQLANGRYPPENTVQPHNPPADTVIYEADPVPRRSKKEDPSRYTITDAHDFDIDFDEEDTDEEDEYCDFELDGNTSDIPQFDPEEFEDLDMDGPGAAHNDAQEAEATQAAVPAVAEPGEAPQIKNPSSAYEYLGLFEFSDDDLDDLEE